MESEDVVVPAKTFKIACSNYPEDFDLDKTTCKTYFRQFGKVRRVIFKQRQRVIIVEYLNEQNYYNALENAGEYEGQSFLVESFESTAPPVLPKVQHQSQPAQPKKKREKVVSLHKISYVDNDEVKSELDAMGGYSTIRSVLDQPMLKDKPRKPPKLNRVWTLADAKKPTERTKKIVSVKKPLIKTVMKKKVKEKTKILTSEQLDLLKVIRSQAQTVDEKYKVLDARDKLLRFSMKKSKLKTNPTIGTCSDMCPEKERLLREIQHQVALFEQSSTGKHSMDHNKAVKQYSRSSADQEAPLPHELRPVTSLQLTMGYLVYNIMDLLEKDTETNLSEWYHFLWDRTRGIRKDITQQNLCCQGSVELLEQCARFHIHCSARFMGEDPSVFDQKINTENLTKCLQTLKYMYHDLALKNEKCPNEAEFRAYIILLNLSDGNFMWEVQHLSEDIQKSPEVKLALQIYSAFEKRNYVKFFKLIKSITYLNSCILMRYFVQVRVQAIETLIKCFAPPKSISFYPVSQLTDILFFDDVESTVDFVSFYGLSIKDGTHIMIDRASFNIPEYPYVLERSSRVESKRHSDVGKIVFGKEFSPEMYMQIQSHEIHNSFDKDGFLIQDEMFNEIETRMEEQLLDEPDSRESTPERNTMVTNIFAQKALSSTNIKRSISPLIFTQTKEEKNIFAPVKTEPENIFTQSKPDLTNIFTQGKSEAPNIFTQSQVKKDVVDGSNIFVPATKNVENIFSNVAEENVFIKSAKEDVNIFKAKETIFVPTTNTESTNIFALKKPIISEEKNIFAVPPVSDSQSILIKKPTPVFGNPLQESKPVDPSNIFAIPRTTDFQKNIFAQEPPKPASAEPKKGGFHFVLNRPQKHSEVPNIFAPGFKPIADVPKTQEQQEREQNEKELEILEHERERLQEELRKEEENERLEKERQEQKRKEQEEIKKREEETRRKNQEAAEKRRLEAERKKEEEIERKKWEEQERIKREQKLKEEKKRLEEDLKRKREELERQRKELEEKQRNIEIQKSVKSVLNKMVEAVDLKIRTEILNRIKENMKKRSLVRICKKWRSTVVKRLKKRKAMDCIPLWGNARNIDECAKDLHTKSQDLTLSFIKRYKYGRPLDIRVIDEQPTGKLNLFYLTYSSLRRRLYELKEKWHQHIYWKVVISIPDIDEMLNGLHKLEETLKSYVNWQLDKRGNTVFIEEHKTVTYCVEKQQGFDVGNSDANAFIFIAKNFNSLLQRRVFENLKDFGIYVKLPVVIVLEDTSNSEEYLDNLRETGVVSDYVIYSCNLSSQVLPSIIDNGLIFLSKKVEKYPPLEMDTLQGFLTKNLCTEMWKKAGSYAKWNHEYNFCMRDPSIVINLYNECLNLLEKIVTDKNSKEYAVFPEIFKDYLHDKIPDFLPCDYRYFPTFWTNAAYEDKLKSIFKSMKLPKFLEKWPPSNETELMISISKYCTDVFTNPKEPFVAIFNLFKDAARGEHFDKLLWTEAIEILSKEKLKEQNLKLTKRQFFESTVDTFIVVYNSETLNDFSQSEWFYRNNPLIEGYKKIVTDKVEKEVEEYAFETSLPKRKRELDISLESADFLDVINKAENLLRAPKALRIETKNQIEQLNRSIKDLEESINVVKRMDEMNLLQKLVES